MVQFDRSCPLHTKPLAMLKVTEDGSASARFALGATHGAWHRSMRSKPQFRRVAVAGSDATVQILVSGRLHSHFLPKAMLFP